MMCSMICCSEVVPHQVLGSAGVHSYDGALGVTGRGAWGGVVCCCSGIFPLWRAVYTEVQVVQVPMHEAMCQLLETFHCRLWDRDPGPRQGSSGRASGLGGGAEE